MYPHQMFMHDASINHIFNLLDGRGAVAIQRVAWCFVHFIFVTSPPR